MGTSNAPDGITTTGKDNNLGATILPDPTKSHTYWEDFDYYVAGDWSLANGTGSSQALTFEDGGVLNFVIGAGEGIESVIVKKGQSFLFESGKELWMKSRFKRSLSSIGYQVGLGINNTDDDRVVFTNWTSSETLDLITASSWTGTGATFSGVSDTNLIMDNTAGAAAEAISTFATIVGVTYTVFIDFVHTNSTATFSARDASDTNELGTPVLASLSQTYEFTFTATTTTTILKWVNTSTTASQESSITSVDVVGNSDTFVIAKDNVRTVLNLGSISGADTYLDLGFYYDGTKFKIYLNDTFIDFIGDDNLPDDLPLSPEMGFLNSDSGAQSADVDYFYAAKNR